MTRIRRIGAVVLATGSVVLGLPLPADAATTSVLTPSNGSVIRSGSSVTAKAHFDFAITMELRVKTPGGGDTFLTKKGGTGDLSAPINLERNGKYTVYLIGRPTNHVYDSNTFTVAVPPARPSGVSGSVSGNRLTVRWNLGLENDLSGYSVKAGGVGSSSGSAGQLCSGTSCSASFSLPSGTSGSVPVSVTAKRPSGTGGSLSSGAASTSVYAGGGGGGTLPGSSVPTLPGTTAPNPSTPLTPFNNESPVTLPSVQPDGATPGFTYPAPQVLNQGNTKAQAVSASSSLQWGKSVGIALILLIVAAHLGTWTRRLRVSQAGVSSQGMAARIARGGTGRKRVSKAREGIAKAEAVAKTAPTTGKSGAGEPGAGKAGAGKPAAAKGDTAVLPVPGAAPQSGGPGKPGGKRRPATLGKRPGGVNVEIAKQAGPSAAEANGKSRRSGSSRRKNK
ncbi:hypothetical protein [Spirillospora sp. NPDC047279]|uniref:hypothetical protein n=1 Tax=Spirillospora sp. NPDC047279 TaxID=3155478 RepID=UPI00340241E1